VLTIGGLSVADVDSPTLTTTLTVANGLLTVVPKAGVTITGNLANAVTISGSVADVNAALAGVNYIGNPGFDGADTLTMVTSDGALTDTDTVAITVNPVNDAPNLDLDADNSSGALGSNFVTTFTKNGSAIALTDTDIVLTDNGPDLTSARFVLINAQAGDSLVVNGTLPAGITATITANELTLTGTVPVAEYRTALGQIRFSNSSNTPDLSDRDITVVTSDGQFDSNVAHATIHVVQPVLHFVGTNDFAVNGRADILWTHDGSAVLWTNSGAAFAEVLVSGHNGAEWSAVGVGHDHSSTGELIWSNGSSGNIDVWQFNGTAISGAAVLPGHMGAEWHVAGLGDFNGDGNTDVLWQSTAGNIDVWSMNGLSLNSAVLSNGQIGAEWHVAATGDFFGTGRDAILWESDSGDLQTWSMNGANVTGFATVGHIGAEWHVAGVGHFLNDGPTDLSGSIPTMTCCCVR
jgi:hypothetical protein